MCSPPQTHWILVWIEILKTSYKVKIYDSLEDLGGEETKKKRQKAVYEILLRLKGGNRHLPRPKNTLRASYQETPQQGGVHECGLAVVSNACRLMSGGKLLELGGTEEATERLCLAREMIRWGTEEENKVGGSTPKRQRCR